MTQSTASAYPEPSHSAPEHMDSRAQQRTVLVAVVNNMDDLRRAASEGWYRIPQRRAPRRIGADYLAFYQTGAFRNQDECRTVTYYAATRRYRLLTRRELLPQEADHPRADDFYFRIELGPLLRLEKPLPSASLRRITFIHTTLERLLHSQDVKELFIKDDPFDAFWQTLRANRLRPLSNRVFQQMPMDITLRARRGYVGIRWRTSETAAQPTAEASSPASDAESPSGQASIQERAAALLATGPDNGIPGKGVAGKSGPGQSGPGVDSRAGEGIAGQSWEVLEFTPAQVHSDPEACLRRIGAALIRLGGSDLNR